MSESGWSVVPNWVVRGDTLDAFGKMSYIVLLNRANARGESWPSMATLCADVGASEKTVRARLQQLVDLGLLVVVPRKSQDGSDLPNLYRVQVWSESKAPSPTSVGGEHIQGGRDICYAPRGRFTTPPVVNLPGKVLPIEVQPNEVHVVAPQSDATATLIPDDWQPSQKHRDKAASLNLDVERETQRFTAHARRVRRRQKNWESAFTNWLRKAAEFAQQQHGSPPHRSRVDQNVAEFNRLYGGGEIDAGAGSLQALDTGIRA